MPNVAILSVQKHAPPQACAPPLGCIKTVNKQIRGRGRGGGRGGGGEKKRRSVIRARVPTASPPPTTRLVPKMTKPNPLTHNEKANE